MSPEKTLDLIIQIVVLLFAVSFHESAHGLVALKCGDTTARDLGRITLNPIKHLDPIGSLLFPIVLAFAGGPVFGWAKPVPVSLRNVRNPRKANLLVSAAGPVSNFFLALVFTLALALVVRGGGTQRTPLFEIFRSAVVINVALAIFNLIPIPPLDGFGVFESLLPPSMIPAAIWLRRYGFLLLLALMFTGILGRVMTPAIRAVLGVLQGIIR